MGTARPWLTALSLTFILAAIHPVGLRAQPVGGGIIDSVDVSRENDSVRVDVTFVCPVRYLTHAPTDRGNEVRIKVDPVPRCQGNIEAAGEDQTIHPETAEHTPLTDVTYEGNVPGGPFLTLRFSRVVDFRVAPTPDYRGITVTLPDSQAEDPGNKNH